MSTASVPRRHRGNGTPLARQLRRALGHDENPLCRSVDRSRSRLLLALAAGLVLALAVGALVALLLLGGMRAHARQVGAHLHPVTATTLSAATDSPTRSLWSAQANASWAYPGASAHTGVIGVPAGTAQGSRLPLWVDDSGGPASPPPPDSELATAAALYGIGALAGVGAVSWVGYQLRRRCLDRRAERAWEPDWERVEPLWSGRGHWRETGGL
ncbi:hypothetical protein OG455_02345 [Kitasatospora sp. NBC_01287]|uniref:Rv1733c family protein n=1 Tax=Kitasatospora sp. NBC_01287 TaxID=2903573 RepID=UPI002251AA85|nr:hypothetical protein [Kitasatospora sp. NBC_01287]MCX4744365.1 hypothetical protein [Kitasatospora sp. NBC_01287]